jgi:hypothetical protein
LFTCFIDPTIDAINSEGPDGWLENLHTLLLMDDTVVFATSRTKLIKKNFRSSKHALIKLEWLFIQQNHNS